MKHAEKLLAKGNELVTPRARMVLAEVTGNPVVDEILIARAKIAMDFARQRKSFLLTALVKDWSPQRIVREMY